MRLFGSENILPRSRTSERRGINSLSRNLLMNIANSVKEAFFPTRCLVCRTFFHPGNRQILDVKESHSDINNFNKTKKTIDKRLITTNHNRSFLTISSATFEMVMDPFLCQTCSTGFLPVGSPKCCKCGIMFKSKEGNDRICGGCLEVPNNYGIARSTGIYEQALMDAIHCFKYREKIQLARPFGMLLLATFINFWDSNSVDLIVPVPLHAKKIRMRGFNPSLLLVRDWTSIAAAFDFYFPDIPIETDVLKRTRWTEPQTGLERKKRMANIKNAFNISHPAKISGKRILLVDDVYTTGATVNECAKVLLRDGAEQVDVLTLARTI